MPIYEFECRKCGKVTERLQGIHDRDMRTCPACGGRVGRKMSNASFVLKGSGWYATDYAGKGNGKGNGKKNEAGASCPASKESAPACSGCPKASAD